MHPLRLQTGSDREPIHKEIARMGVQAFIPFKVHKNNF